MKNKLKDKVIVVTGASSGIGLCAAKKLASLGAKVYGITRNNFEGANFSFFQSDINDDEKIREIFRKIYDKEGKIDVLINNAGYGIAGAIESTKRDSIYNLVNTNLCALINLSAIAIPYLKKSPISYIVNISSIGGIIPLPFQAVYSATKAGVEVFSRALANEVKPFNIKVSAIMPGDIKTGFTKNRIIEEGNESQNYKNIIKKSIEKVERDEQTGKGPEGVVKVIIKILKKKNPPLKIAVGFWYKFVPFLVRILPNKIINWIVGKMYC